MTELLTGLSIGLAAGISPGPLQTLVVTSTLQRGFGAGWRVAVAPLITDLPIVMAGVFLAASIPSRFLNGLAIAGGVLVILVGVWTWREGVEPAPETGSEPADLWRGVVVNLVSPHPWGFWLAAGGPLLIAAWRKGPWFAAVFLIGFYGLLVGSKIALAWAVDRSRTRLSPTWRRRFVVGSAVLLVVGGGLLLWQGVDGRFD